MTTKILTGTYVSGYAIQSPVTTVTVATQGLVLGSGLTGESTVADTVVNLGRISATVTRGVGVYLPAGGSVTNGSGSDFTALISGYRGVAAKAFVSVTNLGTVTGGGYYGAALDLEAGGTVTNGALNDQGALMDGGTGVFANGVPTNVANFGTIEGLSSYPSNTGIWLASGGTVTNGGITDQHALIKGDRGVYMGVAQGAVANFGTIEATGAQAAVKLRFADSVTNGAAGDTTALMEGIDLAVYVGGLAPPVEVDNLGTILATGSAGVGLYTRNAAVTNGSGGANSTALIEGHYAFRLGSGSTAVNYGTILGTGAGGAGVVLGSGYMTNGAAGHTTALIEGATGVSAPAGSIGTLANFATISATGADAVLFTSDNDALIIEPGCAFKGKVEGGGGVLDIAAGSGTLTGLLSSGTVTVSGSMATTAFYAFSTVGVESGANFAVSGPVSIGKNQFLIDSGTLSVGGAVTNDGSIIVGRGATGAELVLASSIRLTGGGTLSLVENGSLKNIIAGASAAVGLNDVDNTISGAGNIGDGKMSLTIGAAGVIVGTTASSLTLDTGANTIANAGLIEAGNAGTVILRSSVNDAGGGVIAAEFGNVYLQGVDIQGGTLLSTDPNFLEVMSGTNILDGRSSIVDLRGEIVIENGQSLTAMGAIDNTGTLNLTPGGGATKLTVGTAGLTLSGAGQVLLGASGNGTIVGATRTATLVNEGNVIDGAGHLGGGRLVLVNGAAGVIENNSPALLVIDTGHTVVNAGTIESASNGEITITTALANTGVVEVLGGVVTADGAVTGAGTVLLEGAGSAVFRSAFRENVGFSAAASGTLELTKSQAYRGTISGFSTTGRTKLDLDGIAFGAQTKATYRGTSSGGTLTVVDGVHTARIKFSGDYTASTFAVSADGHGGTTVVTATAEASTSPPHALVSAMAGLGAAGAAAIHAGDTWTARSPALAAPRTATA